jgi:indole-3-glycerol phosphate synthase
MTRAPLDLLETIVAATRARVRDRRQAVSLTALEAKAAVATPRGRAFVDALSTPGLINVIAECKRRSPSRGVLRAAYDPVEIARSYAAAGAAALSILTEPMFFDGSLAHLESVRSEVSLPLLRKDFIVDTWQLLEARAAGADAVLLIVAALSDADIRMLDASARSLGLATLVEVHSEDELDRALSAGARVVGVNNRNLRTLEVDLDLSNRLADRFPADVVRVSESGLRTASDLAALSTRGYGAFLIGERFMTRPDPGAALADLLTGAPQ